MALVNHNNCKLKVPYYQGSCTLFKVKFKAF